jgi:TPR repeat protein
MGKIAEGASGAGENAGRGWQRGATRRAILDAARLIAARQNSTDFSLNTVAKEAGYSTTTLFAYFQTKAELFNAIIADDLAGLARQLRESYSFSSPPQTEGEPEPQPEPAAVVENSEPEAEVEPDHASSTVVAFAPPAETQPDERAKQPARADAWLERRLRVFEKTLADVETRLIATQIDSAKALSVATEATAIFGARLEASEKRSADLSNDLTTRLTAAEKRLRENHSDLRDRLLNMSTRIDSLEAAAQNVAAQAGYVASAPTEDVLAPAEVAPEEKPLTAAAETYLSAARRAAQTAAALAEIENAPPKKPARNFWFNRATAVLAACIAVIFVFGALVAFALGEHQGRAMPVRTARASSGTMKLALASPLDQLSAQAMSGNPQAELLIGLRYLKGRGVAVNQPEAAKWIRAAATRDPVAQYWMGQITEYGEGVSADAASALHWYTLAAAHGNRDAMYDLGVASAQGLGTQRDFAQSARWFAKAAVLGVTNAQFNLAVLYERGEGVKQSLADAYKWYAIAGANGDVESKQRADAIATQIGTAALASARRSASTFKPGAPPANALPSGRTALASAS